MAHKITIKVPKAPAPSAGSGAGKGSGGAAVLIVVVILFIVVAYLFIRKHGGFKSWFTTMKSPQTPVTASGQYNTAQVGNNILTQADFTAKFPRSDGKGSAYTVTVPNITYVDRFGPGDTWQANNDGLTYKRDGNTVFRLNPNYDPAKNNEQWHNEGTYKDDTWDYSLVQGDTAGGKPTAQWTATPRAKALAQMSQNLADIQKAYDDFGQYFAGKADLYNADLTANTDALNRVYGANNWPAWTKGAITTGPVTLNGGAAAPQTGGVQTAVVVTDKPTVTAGEYKVIMPNF